MYNTLTSIDFREGIFWIFGFICLCLFKVLSFFMPKAYKAVKDSVIKEINKEPNKKLDKLHKELTAYKLEKHGVEGEALNLREAISSNDPELLEELREVFKNENKD